VNKTPLDARTGSVMIFAVLLMTAGVFVLAAVLQLAATQGLSGEAEWDAVQRRVTLGNSRAMAREYMHSRIFRGTVPAGTNATSVAFTNGLGGFNITPAGGAQESYWTALSTTNTDVVLNINPFNLMERGGFYRELFAARLLQGADDIEWSFAVRTRSPIAAGYSFVQQRPAQNDLASLAAPPYIDMNDGAAQFYGFEGMPRMLLSSVTNTMTRVSGDTNGYQGYLDVQEGATVPGLFTNVAFTPRGGGQVQAELDLFGDDPNVANPVLRYDVPSSGSYVTNGVTNTGPVTALLLKGSSSEMRKPLHIVAAAANTNLSLLVLSNSNVRRVYFYRARESNAGVFFDVVSANAGSWRLGLTMSQCDVQFEIGNLEITGGLRTDGNINFQAGSANFVPETDPGGLDFIADRMMWLEDYRAQQ
jgi:hypothetical protein